ncbi:MAG: FlgD immunoglobulin-like domain containing protein [Candidatus Eisenbacteria bacterium]
MRGRPGRSKLALPASLGAFAWIGVIASLALAAWSTRADASVPRMVWIEQFGATWCSYCPFARCALDRLEHEAWPSCFRIETHLSPQDPFTTAESQARADRYGVSGIPHVVFDGVVTELGATACAERLSIYRADLAARVAATGGVSPIEITGGLAITGNIATVTAHVRLVDPASFVAHQATLFIYEDGVPWCCGGEGDDHWNRLVRMVRSTPIALVGQGAEATVSESWDWTTAPGAPADPARLRAAAVYEEIGGTKEVLQATDFVSASLALPRRVASVPNGNGTASFTALLTNLRNEPDTLHLTIGGFPWPADFQIAGDPVHYTAFDLPLAGREARAVTLWVHTDDQRLAVDGSFTATSIASNQTTSVEPRVFNRSPALLLLDLDSSNLEAPFLAAFDARGDLYDARTTAPYDPAELSGYDCVIAETGLLTAAMGQAESDLLHAYLAEGDKLLLSSMDFLTNKNSGDLFVQDDLGVASWNNNTKANQANGVSGDPITNGMSMPLSFSSNGANRVDTLIPAAGASAIFHNEVGHANAVRTELPNHARVVFSTILQSAFPQSGVEPNTSTAFLGRALDWLLGSDTSGAIDSEPAGARDRSRIVAARSVSSSGASEIEVRLSPHACGAPAAIRIIDAGGRQVHRLAISSEASGTAIVRWDGRDAAGNPLPNGLYFLSLESADGVASGRLLRVR